MTARLGEKHPWPFREQDRWPTLEEQDRVREEPEPEPERPSLLARFLRWLRGV